MDQRVISKKEEQNIARFLGSTTSSSFNEIIKLSKDIAFAIKTTRPYTEEFRKKYKNFERKFYSILMAIAWIESTFEQDAVGRHGEIGAFQIKIATARGINKKYNLGYSAFISELGTLRSSSIIAAYLIIEYLKMRESFKQSIRMYNQGPRVLFPNKKDIPKNIKKRNKNADNYYAKVHNKMHRIRRYLELK